MFRAFLRRSKLPKGITREERIARGKKWAEVTGIESPFEEEEEPSLPTTFNWSSPPEEFAKRLLMTQERKIHRLVPSDGREMEFRKLKRLVPTLPGFQQDGPTATNEILEAIVEAWEEAYEEKLEEIRFNQLSNYEP